MRSIRVTMLAILAACSCGAVAASAADPAPKPVIRKGVLLVDKGGVVVPLGCSGKSGVCAGRIRLRSTSGQKLGSIAYRLSAGKRAAFRVKVSASTRRKVAGGMKAKAEATAGKLRAVRTVTLRMRRSS